MSQINMMAKISIIGCGNSGGLIAVSFANIGYQIDIIDINYKKFKTLPENLISEGYLNPIVADATKIENLKKVMDPESNICIILSGNDSNNALISQIVKNELNIPKVICELNEEITSELYLSLGFIVINKNDLFKKNILDLFERD
ncbi:MAG: hypothetical protein CL758_08735 [Chloroflexi bacterium]|nr:hypothetical protein [Chloroflexota bacterium]